MSSCKWEMDYFKHINLISSEFHASCEAIIKAWPNARNISTQHLATLLGTTCCVRLATLLRYVAMCCNMLDDVGSNFKTVKFFVQHFRRCMMLYSFDHVHATLLRLSMRAWSTCYCNAQRPSAPEAWGS